MLGTQCHPRFQNPHLLHDSDNVPEVLKIHSVHVVTVD